MLTCNCTLAGTLTCKSCPEYIKYFGTSNIRHDSISEFINRINKYVGPNGVVYSSDRYELVEKKDWKINNLKKELKEIEDNIEQKKLEIESCNIFIEQYEKDLEAINSKLKELETNKE